MYFKKKDNIHIQYLLQIFIIIDTKMKISFTKKLIENDHLVILVPQQLTAVKLLGDQFNKVREIINDFLSNNPEEKSSKFKTLSFRSNKKI